MQINNTDRLRYHHKPVEKYIHQTIASIQNMLRNKCRPIIIEITVYFRKSTFVLIANRFENITLCLYSPVIKPGVYCQFQGQIADTKLDTLSIHCLTKGHYDSCVSYKTSCKL